MHIATGLPELPKMFHPKTGDVILAQNLPTGGGRWTPLRKCLVIEGISKGLISEEGALAKYGFSKDELLKMRALYERFGLSGLGVGKMEMGMSSSCETTRPALSISNSSTSTCCSGKCTCRLPT